MAFETIDYTSGSAVSNVERNRVMRNTYWLLALTMIPTVLGAYVGILTGITQMMTGFTGFIVFMIGAMGFIWAIQANRNSGLGVALLLAFTFFMGLMLSNMIGFVMGFSNGASLVTYAFGGTAAIFFSMATLSTVIKRDLSGMGKWLFAGLIVLMVAMVANIFFQSTAAMAALSALAIALFSGYLLFDLKRIVDGGETNYISATLSLYINLFNIFQNLLALFGIFGGSND